MLPLSHPSHRLVGLQIMSVNKGVTILDCLIHFLVETHTYLVTIAAFIVKVPQFRSVDRSFRLGILTKVLRSLILEHLIKFAKGLHLQLEGLNLLLLAIGSLVVRGIRAEAVR